MTPQLNLDAYFNRIQWGGSVRPSYDTLAQLVRAHMRHIPFENLDVLLGRGIRIDLESIQNKLVRARRGGYCFEHATLFAAVLEQLGFQPVRHSSRVIIQTPRVEAPRTHMFLTVPLPEGTFVVDPGFGGLAPRVPVPLDGTQANIDGELHWMVRDETRWVLRAQVRSDTPVDAWVTTLEQDYPIDFEMANYYTCTYPASPFMNRILMRSLTDEGRVTVMNRDATIWRGNTPHRIELEDRRALRGLLTEYFGIDLPEVEHMRVPGVPEWG
ncbi:arylamine N-acetyltransferase [Ralstonia sp. SET104]|uniref:arylamine N-acetyltransferase family protein n=1 Tax=Ralstonia sp. SET104 TaxID=2448774 RepID=UPI000FFADB7A|nr:arylamine N-acetyltransferase [Ralstonia sp. SET104]GCB02837.1 arylamine N-acetyltransferase [Ralstonia sp. SET104]